MARNYLARLEALEAKHAPPHRLLIVRQRQGEDSEAAIARTCAECGVPRYVDYQRLVIVNPCDD